MLHQLAASAARRDIWWIHGAADPREHPLAAEAHDLLASLPHAHEHIFYSAATPEEAQRRMPTRPAHHRHAGARSAVPVDAKRIHLRTGGLHDRHPAALVAALGIDAARVHTELFGALASINPGVTDQTPGRRTSRPARRAPDPLVTFARSGLSTPIRPAADRAVLELADACDVPHPLELPHRRVPHLRHATGVRRCRLQPGAARSRPPTARCSSAARTPDDRRRARPLIRGRCADAVDRRQLDDGSASSASSRSRRACAALGGAPLRPSRRTGPARRRRSARPRHG